MVWSALEKAARGTRIDKIIGAHARFSFPVRMAIFESSHPSLPPRPSVGRVRPPVFGRVLPLCRGGRRPGPADAELPPSAGHYCRDAESSDRKASPYTQIGRNCDSCYVAFTCVRPSIAGFVVATPHTRNVLDPLVLYLHRK